MARYVFVIGWYAAQANSNRAAQGSVQCPGLDFINSFVTPPLATILNGSQLTAKGYVFLALICIAPCVASSLYYLRLQLLSTATRTFAKRLSIDLLSEFLLKRADAFLLFHFCSGPFPTT